MSSIGTIPLLSNAALVSRPGTLVVISDPGLNPSLRLNGVGSIGLPSTFFGTERMFRFSRSLVSVVESLVVKKSLGHGSMQSAPSIQSQRSAFCGVKLTGWASPIPPLPPPPPEPPPPEPPCPQRSRFRTRDLRVRWPGLPALRTIGAAVTTILRRAQPSSALRPARLRRSDTFRAWWRRTFTSRILVATTGTACLP